MPSLDAFVSFMITELEPRNSKKKLEAIDEEPESLQEDEIDEEVKKGDTQLPRKSIEMKRLPKKLTRII